MGQSQTVKRKASKAHGSFFRSFVVLAAIIGLTGCQSSPNTAPNLTFQEKPKASFELVPPKVSEPFKSYDAMFVEAVTKRWHDFLNTRKFLVNQKGAVELKFYLHSDGRITDMKVVKNTVGELRGYICKRAVEDPAPYASWSEEMRLKVGKDYREMQFAFYYN